MSTNTAFRYVTGGTVAPDSPSYVARPCDAQLLELCRRGEFAYVLTSRQMGKSSLMTSTTAALQADGCTVATIDLTIIGVQQVTSEQWYLGLLAKVEQDCQPATELFGWWAGHAALPLAQRFWRYLTEVLLPEVPGRIVIFVDEIDSTLGLDFTDDFFATIRALHNARAQQPELNRLSFVLLGVATPGELIRDQSRTPFNIGTRVEINDFTADEARALVQALGTAPADVEPLLSEILRWTGGQPFLTQKLCALIASSPADGARLAGGPAASLADTVRVALLSESGRNDPHFQFIAQYLLAAPAEQKDELFATCSRLLAGRPVTCRDASPVHNRLRLSGIAKRVDGQLLLRNALYAKVFGAAWVRANRPTFWTQANRRLVAASAAAVALSLAAAVTMYVLYAQAREARLRADAALLASVASNLKASEARQEADRSLAGQSAARAMAEEKAKQATESEKVATEAKDAAEKAAALAELEKGRAQETQQQAQIALNTTHLALRRLATRSGSNPTEEIAQRALASYAIGGSQIGNEALARAAGLTGLHAFLQQSGHLYRMHAIPGLAPTPALAYSPDGSVLAVGGMDGDVRLLDADSLKELGRLSCRLRGEAAWSLAFSRDGRRLAVGYADNTSAGNGSGSVCFFDRERPSRPRHWRVAENEKLRSDIYSVAVGEAAGREVVLAGGSEGALHWWVTADGLHGRVERASGSEPADTLVSVAINDDNSRVALGGDKGGVDVLDMAEVMSQARPQPIRLGEHLGTVQFMAFAPKRPALLLSTGNDGRIIVWDVEHRCLAQRSKLQTSRLFGLAVMEDRMVASANVDGTLGLFNWSEDSCEPPAKAKDPPAGKADKTDKKAEVKEFDVVEEDGIIRGHEGTAYAVAFNAARNRLASTGRDGSLRIMGPSAPSFSSARLTPSDTVGTKMDGVVSLAIQPDGQSVTAGDNKGWVRRWTVPREDADPSTTQADAQRQAHASPVRGLAYAQVRGRELLVSVSEDGQIVQSDPRTLQAAGRPIQTGRGGVAVVALSPDGKTVAIGDRDAELSFWSLESGALQGSIARPKAADLGATFKTVSFSADGKYVAASIVPSDGSYLLHVIAGVGEPARRGEWLKSFVGVSLPLNAFARAGRGVPWLASVGDDGRLLLWSRRVLDKSGSGETSPYEQRMSSGETPLTSVAISEDGEFTLVGGEKGLVQLWSTAGDGVLVGERFEGHGQSTVSALAIAAHSEFFVTAAGSTILLWPGPPRWAGIACRKLGQNMSETQWKEWISKSMRYKEQCPGLPRRPNGS